MRPSPRAGLPALALLLALAGCGDGQQQAGPPAPPVFTGDLACADCAAIATTLTLFPGDSFLLKETYRGTPDGDRNYTSRGTWASMADAVNPSAGRVVLLSPNQGMPRRFRQLGDTALRQLDQDGKEFESKANVFLRRQP